MCDDREKLIAYLYDEVDASDRRLVDAHLATCAECRDELRSLRSVRQDLLAWDVPEHGSVWKPFATPVVTPWWKQVPAWGLAAAATLMFGLGMAGGFAARALMPVPATMAAATPVTTPSQPQAVPTATQDEVRELRERLASLEKIALTATTPAEPALTRAELEQRIGKSQSDIKQYTALKLVSMVREMDNQRLRDLQAISAQIDNAQGFNARALTTALNRTEKEK